MSPLRAQRRRLKPALALEFAAGHCTRDIVRLPQNSPPIAHPVTVSEFAPRMRIEAE